MTTRPNDYGMAIGAAMAATAILLAVNVSVFVAIMLGVSAFGLTLILIGLPALLTDATHSWRMASQHLHEARSFGKSPVLDAAIDNADEVKRRAAWRAFWIECLTESNAHGGVIAYNVKGGWGMNALLNYEQWYNDLCLPFIRSGWIAPVHGGVKTQLVQPLGHVLNELSAGRLPMLPYGLPPDLKASKIQTGESVLA